MRPLRKPRKRRVHSPFEYGTTHWQMTSRMESCVLRFGSNSSPIMRQSRQLWSSKSIVALPWTMSLRIAPFNLPQNPLQRSRTATQSSTAGPMLESFFRTPLPEWSWRPLLFRFFGSSHKPPKSAPRRKTKVMRVQQGKSTYRNRVTPTSQLQTDPILFRGAEKPQDRKSTRLNSSHL